jgi:hypothetical protein
MGFLEERMRAWVAKKETFKVFEMVPSNGAQFLDHHGERGLARLIRKEKELVALLQLDRFFFRLEGEAPRATNDSSFFKLVCFWNLKNGIRILGTGSSSKEKLKELVLHLKAQKDPQKKLEELGVVGWIQNQLIWEVNGENLKDLLRKKIMTLYHEFDRVFIATSSDLTKILIDWVGQRKRRGFQFREKMIPAVSQEPWDSSLVLMDHSWGKVEEITSFLHLATKFLTMLKLDYQLIGVGKISAQVKKIIDACVSSWTLQKGHASRLEFQVVDSLGRAWKMSTLEWNEKQNLLQMSLCVSFERCIALLVDQLEDGSIKTVLDRLK